MAKKFKFGRLPLAIAVSSFALSQAASSQVLEEMVVTAQKRAENLQDVPVSVAAVTGEKIANAGIQNLQQMSDYVPNFVVRKGTIGDLVNIRGIQSGIQAGFEQSVGTFVDGVYRGRAVQSRYSFMDVGMVEVLRGPQGTLFGKNTVAGALNITSAAPTEEFEGKLKATYNFEFEGTEVLGVVSGPLSETVRARLAIQTNNQDDGWVENIYDGEGYGQVNDQAGRLSVDIDASESTELRFRGEYGEWRNQGLAFQTIRGTGSSADALYYGDTVGLDYRTNIAATNLLTGMQDPVQSLESPQDFSGDMQEYSFTVEHEFSNNSTLTAIGTYSDYTFNRLLDADFNAAALARFDEYEAFDQGSFELRIASDTGQKVEYIAGIYYQNADLTAAGTSYFGIDTIGALGIGGCAAATGAVDLAGAGQQSVLNPSADIAYTCYLAAAGYQTGMSLDPTTGQISAGAINGLNRYALLEQNSETYAVFGQVTYNFTDSTALTVGLRYTDETKTADQSVNATPYEVGATSMPAGCELDPACAGYVGLAEALGEFTTHDFDGLKRDEEDFTWSVNLQHDLNDETMVYVSSASGAKAGGFNSFYMGGTNLNPDNADFEGEDVLTYELGSKMRLMDGRADLNLAYFYTEYDDLQASVFSGNTTYEVRNAAAATTMGIEVDGRFAITDDFLMNASFGWLDFEFDSFPEQACTGQQFIDWRNDNWVTMANAGAGFVPINLLNNAGCSADAVNDLAGRTGSNTPEFSATVGFQYYQNFSSLNLAYALDFNYQDQQYMADDLDPDTLIDAEVYINASIRLLDSNDSWSIAVIGNNLSDVNTFTYAADMPLQTGAQYVITAPPRSVSLQAEYNF